MRDGSEVQTVDLAGDGARSPHRTRKNEGKRTSLISSNAHLHTHTGR